MESYPLSKELIQKHYESLRKISSRIPDDYWELSHYLKDMPLKWSLSYILMCNDEPAAFIIASSKEDLIHINRIAVSENFQNSGLGSLLLDKIVEQLKHYQKKGISLKVGIRNIKAINWYFNKGFFIQNVHDDYFEMKHMIF